MWNDTLPDSMYGYAAVFDPSFPDLTVLYSGKYDSYTCADNVTTGKVLWSINDTYMVSAAVRALSCASN